MRPKRRLLPILVAVVTILCLMVRQAQLVVKSYPSIATNNRLDEDIGTTPPGTTSTTTNSNNNNNARETTGNNNIDKVNTTNDDDDDDHLSSNNNKLPLKSPSSADARCALMFFGLPRSFDLLVLPSIVKNILIPNKHHRCDIFVHFYVIQSEAGGRSGSGGTIDPTEVYKLQDAVRELYNNNNINNNNNNGDDPSTTSTIPLPIVRFTNDTDVDYHRKRGEQIEKYHNTKDADGNYTYFPWKANSYIYPVTMDNIVKQWHSIQSVWELMTQTAQQLKRNYTRVAMLRNDVVFVTPFDLYKRGMDTPIDTKNTDVIIPNWARYPINDRMIYGPHDAVKIWATERFERLETYVKTHASGWAMHSEKFLNSAIFPAIRQSGYGVDVDPDVCFFRARVDGSAWISDCTTGQKYGDAKGFEKTSNMNAQALMETIVERPCFKSKFTGLKTGVKQVHCLRQEAEQEQQQQHRHLARASDNATTAIAATTTRTSTCPVLCHAFLFFRNLGY